MLRGMNTHRSIFRRLRRYESRAGFALTLLVAAGLTGWIMPAPPEAPPKQLVRWTGEGHDWLLVGDRQGDRINAYDMHDGRPLATLDRGSGLADVDRLVVEGHWLLVLGRGRPTVVRLPSFQVRPLASVR